MPPRISPRRALLAATTLSLLLTPTTPAALTFTLEDLGTLGGPSSTAYAINDAGNVAGSSTTPDGSTHAFLFSNNTLQDLGTLGGPNSEALALNNSNQLVGYAQTPAGVSHAFLFSNNALQDLGTFAGVSSTARAINNNAQVVGSSTDATGAAIGFLWSPTVSRPRYHPASVWTGIDDFGDAAGDRPIFPNSVPYVQTTYSSNPVATLGFSSGHAYAIVGNSTDYQLVVGDLTTAAGTSHAFRAVASRYGADSTTDLGTLGGTNSHAFAINDSYFIVGNSQTPADAAQHAFLYSPYATQPMVDLNSLLSPASPWTLTDARGINRYGQITGQGTLAGQTHAFRATPTLSWENPAGGDWSATANWGSDIFHPSSAPNLLFNLGHTYTVTVNDPFGTFATSLDIHDDVTLNLNRHSLDARALRLGGPGAHASLTVDQGTLSTDTFQTADAPNSSAEIHLRNGGVLDISADVAIAVSPGTTASVDADGVGVSTFQPSAFAASSLSIGGAGNAVVTVTNRAAVHLSSFTGSPTAALRIGGPGAGSGRLDVSSSARVINDDRRPAFVHPNGTLNISGGYVNLGPTLIAGTLNLSAGTLNVIGGLTISDSPDTHVTFTGGTFDLNDSFMTWPSALATFPLSDVRSWLLWSRHGGDWSQYSGPTPRSLTSSSARSDPTYTHALAYTTASTLLDFSTPTPPTWHNQPVTPSTLLILFTLYGDANLDGKLDADDLSLLDRGYATQPPDPHWTDGDFNYDGQVNQDDYLLIDRALLTTQPPGFTPASLLSQRESQFGTDYVSQLLTSIPEPATPLACVFAEFLFLLPRRRNS